MPSLPAPACQTQTGLLVNSGNGPAIEATSLNNTAIQAASESGFGIEATSGGAAALLARSSKGPGMVVSSDSETGIIASVGFGSSLQPSLSAAETALEPFGHAIAASTNRTNAAGLFAKSVNGAGVEAVSDSHIAVDATSVNGTAVRARCPTGVGLSVEGLLEVQDLPSERSLHKEEKLHCRFHTTAATPRSTILLTPLGNARGFPLDQHTRSRQLHDWRESSAASRADYPILDYQLGMGAMMQIE